MGIFEKKYKLMDLFVGEVRHPFNQHDDGEFMTYSHRFKEFVLIDAQHIATILSYHRAVDGRKFHSQPDPVQDFIGNIQPLSYALKKEIKLTHKYTKAEVLEIQLLLNKKEEEK